MKPRFAALAAVTLIAAAFRLVPHPPNFTRIAAIALFGGAHFPTLRSAFAVPLGALLLSDLALAGTVSGRYDLRLMLFVYESFASIVCLGWCIRRRPILPFVAGVSLMSAVLFYGVSSFGVWACGRLYPMTGQGLAACYAAAIPFFRSTAAGDLFYASLLFGGFEWMQRRFAVLCAEPAAPPASEWRLTP